MSLIKRNIVHIFLFDILWVFISMWIKMWNISDQTIKIHKLKLKLFLLISKFKQFSSSSFKTLLKCLPKKLKNSWTNNSRRRQDNHFVQIWWRNVFISTISYTMSKLAMIHFFLLTYNNLPGWLTFQHKSFFKAMRGNEGSFSVKFGWIFCSNFSSFFFCWIFYLMFFFKKSFLINLFIYL